MEINNLLEYQRVDEELFQFEKSLVESDARKKMLQAAAFIKSRDEKLAKYDEMSKDVVAKYEKLASELSRLSAEIEELNSSVDITDNEVSLNFVKKKAQEVNRRINELRKENDEMFEARKSILESVAKLNAKYKECVTIYNSNKAAVDQLKKDNEEKTSKIVAQLKSTASKFSPDEKILYGKYLAARKAKTWPILYGVDTNTKNAYCWCGMNLSIGSMNNLKNNVTEICSQCGRILYGKGDLR